MNLILHARRSLLALALLAAFVSLPTLVQPALVQAETYRFDPPHTSITFKVKHILANVAGRFNEFSGAFDFDPHNPGDSKLVFVIPAASIDTAVEKRDEHLRSPDFFDVVKYPEIRFESDEIVAIGDNRYEAVGTLSMAGVTGVFTVPFTILGTVDNPMPKHECERVTGLESAFSIDRLKWNVGDGRFFKMGILDRTVQMYISMELLTDKPDCP